MSQQQQQKKEEEIVEGRSIDVASSSSSSSSRGDRTGGGGGGGGGGAEQGHEQEEGMDNNPAPTGLPAVVSSGACPKNNSKQEGKYQDGGPPAGDDCSTTATMSNSLFLLDAIIDKKRNIPLVDRKRLRRRSLLTGYCSSGVNNDHHCHHCLNLKDEELRIQRRTDRIANANNSITLGAVHVPGINAQQQQQQQQQDQQQETAAATDDGDDDEDRIRSRAANNQVPPTADNLDHFRAPAHAQIKAIARAISEDGCDIITGVQGHGEYQVAVALGYDPDAKRGGTSNHYQYRRFQLYAASVFAVVVAVVLGTTMGIVLYGGNDQDSYLHLASMMTSAPTTHRSGIEDQIMRVVGSDVLEMPISPYLKALNWILFDDPMQLSPGDPNLIQRYIASYFYFSTTSDGPWKSCNPPEDPWGGETICTFIVTSPRGNIQSHAWLSNITECRWAGVKCDGRGQITEVDLAGSGLSGTFPEGIYNWPFLGRLVFNVGTLHGPLPCQLAEMPHMVSINVADNQFTGSIPECWWSANALRTIRITGNSITGSIPSEIGNLLDLKNLFLGRNKLTGTLPSKIGLLNSLGAFDVSQNSIRGSIPSEIVSFTRLKILKLHQNYFTGFIPSNIGKLKKLEILSLHTNPMLTGHLPDQLFEILRLEELDLFDCGFSGTLSPKIGRFGRSLTVLRISNNKFHGPIPSEFEKLSVLEKIWLEGNSFTGSVPEGICFYHNHIPITEFKADCTPDKGGNVELRCSCCTHCCNPGGTDCLPTMPGA